MVENEKANTLRVLVFLFAYSPRSKLQARAQTKKAKLSLCLFHLPCG
jgi:hypothetical protein